MKKYLPYIFWSLGIICLSIMDSIMFHGTPPQEYKGLFGDWWHSLKQISLLMFALYGWTLVFYLQEKMSFLLHIVIIGGLSWLLHTLIFGVIL